MSLLNRQALYSKLSTIKNIPLLSKISPSSFVVPKNGAIDGFKLSQSLAYDCVQEAAKVLEVGMSEEHIASWMNDYLNDYGVNGGFHRPLAWFGERCRFKGIRTEKEAFPTSRKLTSPTEPVIFDIAPILNGYVSDIGFTFSLEPNAELIEAREFLLELRENLVKLFGTTKTVAEIWQEIDEKIKARGYQNCHRKYVMSVLGHRVYHIPFAWPTNYAGMYSLRAYWALISRGFFPEVLSPYHKGSKVGLWALEPHIGNRDHNFGAKFEEILVVEEDRAYWLQDDVPHIKLPNWVH